MRRIALYSDVHGNAVALEAVFEDLAKSGVEERYCLGDLVGYGPDPTGVVAMVRATGDPVVRGNYDQGVGDRSGSCGCYYASDQAKSDGAASYTFTAAAVGDDDAAWLLGLRDEVRIEEAGARVLLCHGSPRRINEYLMPDRGEPQLLRLAGDAEADVVCCGHVHLPYHRAMRSAPGGAIVHYVNSGSVGKPKDGDPRAGWVELLVGSEAEVREAASSDAHVGPAGTTDAWIGVRFHRVAYDVERVVAAMRVAGLPDTLGESLRTG